MEFRRVLFRSDIQSDLSIQEGCLETRLICVYYLRPDRRPRQAENIIDTALEASVIAEIAEHIVSEVVLQGDSPGWLLETCLLVGHRRRCDNARQIGRQKIPVQFTLFPRSEERRVGKGCVSTCRYRWS